MAFDAPLPMPAPDLPTVAEHRDQLRAMYSQAINDAVDHVIEQIILPNDQAMFCLDVAQFTTFLMAVKIVEVRGQRPTREHLMAAYWPMQKALKDDVPGMLRKMADQLAAADAQGRANAAAMLAGDE